jgi:hypothetical protein
VDAVSQALLAAQIHFVDRARPIGGFFEELLTVETRDAGPHFTG